jgi:hypothetical protein
VGNWQYQTGNVTAAPLSSPLRGGPPGNLEQFTFHYSNSSGYSNLGDGDVLVNSNTAGPDGNQACQLSWDSRR